MNNFIIIYKILKALEMAMDFDKCDIEQISAKTLGISENRWLFIMEVLLSDGYIKGIRIIYRVCNNPIISLNNPRITLKGLEYLTDNSFMKRAADTAFCV